MPDRGEVRERKKTDQTNNYWLNLIASHALMRDLIARSADGDIIRQLWDVSVVIGGSLNSPRPPSGFARFKFWV